MSPTGKQRKEGCRAGVSERGRKAIGRRWTIWKWGDEKGQFGVTGPTTEFAGPDYELEVMAVSDLRSDVARNAVAQALCTVAGGDPDLSSLFDDKAVVVLDAVVEAIGGAE